MPTNTPNDLHKRYSSRIKDVYVELFNYTFFHSPSRKEEEDQRFIGRERMQGELRDIITGSESKSGAYLVTGFRGMGKTSLVNRTLREISGKIYNNEQIKKRIRIWCTIIAFSFFKPGWIIAIGSTFFFILAFSYLHFFNHKRKNFNLSQPDTYFYFDTKNWYADLKNTIQRTLVLDTKRAAASHFYGLLHEFIIAYIFLAIFNISTIVSLNVSLGERLLTLTVCYFIYLTCLSYGRKIRRLRKHKYQLSSTDKCIIAGLTILITSVFFWYLPIKSGLTGICACWITFFVGLLSFIISRYLAFNFRIHQNQGNKENIKAQGGIRWLKNHINYGHHIHANINLGQDDLKEIDVLRYIAKAIRSKYREWYHSVFIIKRLAWKIANFLIIFFFAGIIYFFSPIYSFFNAARYDTGFIQYFPSQALFLSPFQRDTSILDNNHFKQDYLFHSDIIESKDSNRLGIRVDAINKKLYLKLKKNDGSFTDEILLWQPANKIWMPENMKSIFKEDSLAFTNDSIVISPIIVYKQRNTKYKQGDSIKIEYRIEHTIPYFTSSNYIQYINTRLKKPYKPDPLKIKAPSDSFQIKEISRLSSDTSKVKTERDRIYRRQIITTNGNSTNNSNISLIEDINNTESYSILSAFNNFIRRITIPIDYFLYVSYEELKKLIVPIQRVLHLDNIQLTGMLNNGNGRLDSNFHLVPLRLDYFFVIFLILCFLVKRFFTYRPILGLRPHRYILRRLDRLIDNIQANIIQEQTGNIPTPFPNPRIPLFSRRFQKSYPILETKAIERELISILNDINAIPQIAIRPKFILVFDELDKIEPRENLAIADKEEEVEEAYFDSIRPDGSRKRQEVIAKILANLKHFLNTANAKFIFIAGREMYDASLADISDRDSAIGSIFHKVIYVNSFFTDPSDGRLTDTTSMTEYYVSQFLFPNRIDYNLNLQGYNQYLKDQLGEDTKENKEKRYKIIFFLHNFINYLAYRSNGAPKKITALFERNIKTPNRKDLFGRHSLTIGKNANNLYLHFDYYNQYKIGLTSYLFTPFIMRTSQHIHEFGDKLLVSSSFLMDHLYKFHKFGFAWRTLEMTPEIVSINKAPELREFIEELVHFASYSHIREIFSGLYEYRFNKKISSEIEFVSKISETESAAFNFTLDESLQIKRHYKRKLQELRNSHKSSNAERYIHSISFVHMILGDLHFYDQEYDDAIIQYMDAVQTLRQIDANDRTLYQIILLVRNMLKMGLTFEKKKTFGSAFMTYGMLTKMILEMREIHLENLGLKYFVVKQRQLDDFIEAQELELKIFFKEEAIKRKVETLDKKSIRDLIEEIYFHSKDKLINEYSEILIIGRPKATKPINLLDLKKAGKEITNDTILFQSFDRMETFYDFTEGQKIAGTIENSPLNFPKEKEYVRLSTLEGLRLIYQPLIARLHMIEKSSLGGVTDIDLKRSKQEFDFLVRTAELAQKFYITSEYYNKVGDILFYKNGFLYGTDEQSNLLKSSDNVTNITSEEVYKVLYYFRIIQPKDNSTLPSHFKVPISAYLRYIKSLYILVERVASYDLSSDVLTYIDKDDNFIEGGLEIEKDINLKIINLLQGSQYEARFPLDSKSFYLATANSMIDTADTILCFATANTTIRAEVFKTIVEFQSLDILDRSDEKEDHFRRLKFYIEEGLTSLEQTILYYYAGGILYAKVGQFRLYLSQLIKLLHLLRDYRVCSPENERLERQSFIDKVIYHAEKIIVSKALKTIFRTNENINRAEIDKMRKILKEKRQYPNNAYNELFPYLYNNISVSADTREVIMLFNLLKLKSSEYDSLLKLRITSANSIIYKKYNRILELRFQADVNYKLFAPFIDKLESFDKDASITFSLSSREYSEIVHPLLKQFDLESARDMNDQEEQFRQIVRFLITDSIFCLSEVIKSLRIFGLNNYAVASYSSLAYAHEKLGNWYKYYSIYVRFIQVDDRLEKEVESLVGDTHDRSYRYHFEMALKYFYEVISLHNAKDAFVKMSNNMYYLDDDYNDSIHHFTIALERYKINTGIIEKKISIIKKQVNNTTLYSYKNYIGQL